MTDIPSWARPDDPISDADQDEPLRLIELAKVRSPNPSKISSVGQAFSAGLYTASEYAALGATVYFGAISPTFYTP